MTSFIYFICGAILFYIFLYGCTMGATDISKEHQALKEANQDQDLEKRKKKEWEKAWRELCYDDGKKEYEFWIYFGNRERGKLRYVVPEFEQRIVKMNKLKKRQRN